MNQDQTINLNHNAAECIKSASRFGETIYTNICNGNVSHVTWGGADWALAFFLMALGFALSHARRHGAYDNPRLKEKTR